MDPETGGSGYMISGIKSGGAITNFKVAFEKAENQIFYMSCDEESISLIYPDPNKMAYFPVSNQTKTNMIYLKVEMRPCICEDSYLGPPGVILD
jgi:hypothetical protein